MLKSKGVWQPLILAILLTAGFALVWTVASGWLASVYDHSHPNTRWKILRFKADGTPVIQTVQQYHDLAGNEIEVSDKNPLLDGIGLPGGAHEPTYLVATPWDQR